MLAAGEPVDETLSRIAQRLRDQVEGVGDVSVSLVDSPTVRTVVSTGARALELDEVQYELGAGPCLDAARTGRTVVVDTRAPAVHHSFCHQAYDRGVRHLMSIGLTAPPGCAAGLNVYGTAREPFDAAARTLAASFAGYASAAVNRVEHGADPALALEWQAALTSRAAVDRAVLALMVNRSCTRDEALEQLLKLSRSRGRRLVQTARSIIDG